MYCLPKKSAQNCCRPRVMACDLAITVKDTSGIGCRPKLKLSIESVESRCLHVWLRVGSVDSTGMTKLGLGMTITPVLKTGKCTASVLTQVSQQTH